MQELSVRKKMIIAGAGQFGRAAAGLLNDSCYELTAFADNSPQMQGTFLTLPLWGRLPVLSMKDAVSLHPDIFLTGVADKDRTAALLSQLRSLNWQGPFLTLQSLYEVLDIRSAVLQRLAVRIQERSVPGAVAELGVYKGDLAWKINALFPDRPFFLFDTFEGFDLRDVTLETQQKTSRARTGDFQDTSMPLVRSRLPFPEKAFFRKGYFPDTTAGLEGITYAFVSLDADLYAPILAGLEFFIPRMSSGGMILLHDYGNERFRGAKKAVEDFERLHGPLNLVPLCDLHRSAVIL